MMTLEEVRETQMAAFGEDISASLLVAGNASSTSPGKEIGLQLKTKAATSGGHQPLSPSATASPKWTIKSTGGPFRLSV
jgi:hypothetical protein